MIIYYSLQNITLQENITIIDQLLYYSIIYIIDQS